MPHRLHSHMAFHLSQNKSEHLTGLTPYCESRSSPAGPLTVSFLVSAPSRHRGNAPGTLCSSIQLTCSGFCCLEPHPLRHPQAFRTLFQWLHQKGFSWPWQPSHSPHPFLLYHTYSASLTSGVLCIYLYFCFFAGYCIQAETLFCSLLYPQHLELFPVQSK